MLLPHTCFACVCDLLWHNIQTPDTPKTASTCFACVCDLAVSSEPHTCFACKTHPCLWFVSSTALLPRTCFSPGVIGPLSSHYTIPKHCCQGTAVLLPHTCFACVCDLAVDIGPDCHVASHTPALLVCMTRSTVVGLTPALPVRHTAACGCVIDCPVASHLLFSWSDRIVVITLHDTKTLLPGYCHVAASHLLCFYVACVCDQAVNSA